MSNFPLVFRRNKQNYQKQNYQIFCKTRILSYLWTHICTAFIFFSLFSCLTFCGYIICSLKNYLTSFTTVILTIIFWQSCFGLKSIPVPDISAPSLLPPLNSDMHPRNQSCLLKICWIKSRTQNNPKMIFFGVCIWFLALKF